MKLKYLYLVLVTVTSITMNAQQAKIKKADRDYDNFAYIDAIKIYERLAEKGYKDIEMFKKVGNAYYFNAELEKAEKWYSELFSMTQEVEPEYYYRFSQALKAAGHYEKANAMLDVFNSKSSNDLRAKLYSKQKDYLQVIEENSGRYSTENAGINSEFQDYGTSFFENQLIFTSSRETKGMIKKIHKWNNQSFTSFYASKVDGDGNLQKPEKFQPNIDTKFDEATPAFTSDGIIYFTASNAKKGKKGQNKNKITLLKLYKATLGKDGNYTNVIELPFSSDHYSTAHPTLSPDEKTLYFASDMPGSYGQSDLYKVSINTDGSFGQPENLGNTINTEGKETFPFISADNELYFSSDGHPGLGGLDVFVSKMENNIFKASTNVGAPINSRMDDFAFLIDVETKVGFFSSNREGGLGYDDIYKFKELKKISSNQSLTGVVADSKNGAILGDVKVILFDEKMNKVAEVYSDKEGVYNFDELDNRKAYYVRAEKKDYMTVEKMVLIASDNGKTESSIVMDPTVIPVRIGDDIAKAFKIEIIYFDLDKWDIRPDAAFELAKIVEVLKENPRMKMDVRSHTDSRQTREYNEKLSEKRAKSTMEWMIQQGIEANRLTGKGYGETQLINKCSDNTKCTEEEHQINRRSEFIIIQL